MAKRKRRTATRRVTLTPTSQPEVVTIAAKIAGLNKREVEIKRRLTSLRSEDGRLTTEFQSIQERRLELQRSFDSAARPS
jgi:predicted  nucleic acid-binding Zn-ribbon protein